MAREKKAVIRWTEQRLISPEKNRRPGAVGEITPPRRTDGGFQEGLESQKNRSERGSVGVSAACKSGLGWPQCILGWQRSSGWSNLDTEIQKQSAPKRRHYSLKTAAELNMPFLAVGDQSCRQQQET